MAKKNLRNWLYLIFTALFFITQARALAAQSNSIQIDEARQKAADLLARMTPEQKIGQIFLVTFKGTEIGPESGIFELITKYNIGGVVLSAKNNNIPADDPALGTTIDQVYNMIRQHQINRWTASQISQDIPSDEQGIVPEYIPLFIGIAQEGDGYPYDQILSGLTPLPNQMAIGATWKPDLSRQVGSALGEDLANLGVNLLLGPSLDVLETQFVPVANDLGTRTFGGDPYWVGKLGQAYIEGVHQGSGGKVAVIAKNFPGLGSSDRSVDDEISTIRKTLEELKSIELTPFFAVTGGAPNSEATADGLLATHIRYQGLQGNIRITTEPITFDQQAFNLVMQLPSLERWRGQGGLVVSDDLGSQALRDFYQFTDQRYDITRRVALDAFLAGNDMLYVSDFSSGTLVSHEAAVETLGFLSQKYNEDQAFAQRVDEAVLRILTLKYKLYEDFLLFEVVPTESELARIDQSSSLTFDTAQQAATLISPSQVELADTLTNPPADNDKIVLISDTRTGSQCNNCEEFSLIPEKAMEEIILGRYGPQGTGQVLPENLKSYSLAGLDTLLNETQKGNLSGQSRRLEQDLTNANWIVFNMLDASDEQPSFLTLSRFLSERLDLIQEKKLIVFAFNAPYFLDETDISKLTAYYGLYSKMPAFIDVAAYLLFQDNLQPVGSLPVSVPGINYDINEALFPDADQVIPLTVRLISTQSPIQPTPVGPGQVPEVQIGDVIRVQTGVIYDNNGRQIPDGTPIEFLFSIGGEANPIQQLTTSTDGVGAVEYTVNAAGTLVIRASSQPAQSEFVVLSIPVPPGEATLTPVGSEALTTEIVTPEPTESTASPLPGGDTPPSHPEIGDWAWAILVTAGVSLLSYRAFVAMKEARWGLRAALLAMVGGLLAYSYLALGLPGSAQVLEESALRTVILVSMAGALLGLGLTVVWQQIASPRKS